MFVWIIMDCWTWVLKAIITLGQQEGAGNVQERLDRALATRSWNDLFSNSHLFHLPRVLSDHCPIRLDLVGTDCSQERRRKKRRFRFETIWLDEEQCTDIIYDTWYGRSSDSSKSFMESVRHCGEDLLNWDR